jgi:hypothetical protein
MCPVLMYLRNMPVTHQNLIKHKYAFDCISNIDDPFLVDRIAWMLMVIF